MNLFDTDQNGGHSCISATVDFSERFCLKILVEKNIFLKINLKVMDD